MARRALYVFRNGKMVNVDDLDREKPSSLAPAIQVDTMDPLKHPVTGQVFDSKSQYLKATKEVGCEVVGNDLLSKQPQRVKDKLTEEKILDGIEKAEAILSDPAKYNARQNEIMAVIEKRNRYLYGR